MLLKAAVLSALLVVLVAGQEKRGSCPPLPDVEHCTRSCYDDGFCPGSLKCCGTQCGGSFCASPVAARRAGKPGVCPVIPSGPWVCSSRCRGDSDCRGKKKCCRNRCGAMACSAPAVRLF